VVEAKGRKVESVDLVGPICETGDFLARDRELPLPKAGEYLAVMNAGAYGFALSSNYNARPRPAEVLVDGEEVLLIRERESYEDLVRGEIIPPPPPLPRSR
jgi:diaminopimelate decarboxylase